jgi:two-component system sensor histidine kinase YesM
LPDVYIVVNVKEDTFRALIRQNMASNRVEQLLFTRGAQPVFQAQKDAILADGGLIRDRISQQSESNVEYRGKDGREYLVNYAALGMNPEWVLVGYQSKSDLLAPMRNIRWSILMIMGGCIVLALIISSVVSDVLLRPLFKLRSLMLKVEQNHLDVRFESRYQDEVTQVGYKFNRMLEQIGALIDEVKLSEREKRKSEIKALQAQIDPHFLYNTLNTIFWKSELEEHEAVKDMIVSLSLLFRLGLSNGREVTTLGDELEHVRQYLNLQSRCYEELFDYSIEVEDPVLLELPILKIMLQPLVENSILHGFKDMTARGRIVIAVSRTEDILRIEVSDNGAGMDVREVQQRMTEPGTGRQSYALSNVGSRLTLYYGDKSSLLMNSVPYEETKITLIIPIETGGASSNGRQAG